MNDVFSLLVALWAIRLARAKSTNDYTYGWQRAEVLGALVNGVFLLALCLSIFLEAIQRFFEPQEIKDPWLVLGVGSAGLASNIVGLFLFHEHGHSHGGGGDHGHSHGHSHSHSHDVESAPEVHTTQPVGIAYDDDEDANILSDRGDIEALLPGSYVKRMANPHHRERSNSRPQRFASAETDIHVHPAANRAAVVAAAASDHSESVSNSDDDTVEGEAHETTALIRSPSPSSRRRSRSDSVAIHKNHHHNKPKKSKSGHSHENLNMRGVFLHVLGDALGNVGVMLTAIFVRFAPNHPTLAPFTNYADPLISLIITIIIFSSALPLVKSASKILLQGVPKGISLEEVKADIMDIRGVEGIHELHIWQLSDVKMIASLHIRIGFDPEGPDNGEQRGGERRYMRLAKAIRTCFHAFGVHSVTIQPEYIPPGVGEEGGRRGEGYGAVMETRAGSKGCLLECGAECGGGKCCGPVVDGEQGLGGGHGHGHAH